MVIVRAAREDELARLPALEAAADTRFADLGYAPFPGPGTVAELRRARLVLVAVADGEVVGCARVDDQPEGPHLEQLSVLPAHGRRGVGRALVETACAVLAAAGERALTLCTFADVAFNGPFYATLGFVEMGPEADWLAARGRVDDHGLERFGRRIWMRRALGPR